MNKIDEPKSLTDKSKEHLIYSLDIVKGVIDEYKKDIESGDVVFSQDTLIALYKLFESVLYKECWHDHSCNCGHVNAMVRDSIQIIKGRIKRIHKTKYFNLIKFLLTWGKNEYTKVLFDNKQYYEDMKNDNISDEYKNDIAIAKSELEEFKKEFKNM